jgi:hypothetical protein
MSSPPLWMAVIGGKYCTVPPYAVVRLKDEETVIGNVISRSFRNQNGAGV